ncbi:MAG: hypothetical protein ACK47B_23905 [Armatimonadota bacterium]
MALSVTVLQTINRYMPEGDLAPVMVYGQAIPAGTNLVWVFAVATGSVNLPASSADSAGNTFLSDVPIGHGDVLTLFGKTTADIAIGDYFSPYVGSIPTWYHGYLLKLEDSDLTEPQVERVSDGDKDVKGPGNASVTTGPVAASEEQLLVGGVCTLEPDFGEIPSLTQDAAGWTASAGGSSGMASIFGPGRGVAGFVAYRVETSGAYSIGGATAQPCERMVASIDNFRLVEGAAWESMDFARHPLTGQLFVVRTNTSGAVVLDRYTDAETDTIEETISIHGGPDCHRPKLSILADGIQRVLFQQDDELRLSVSRNNGRTWTVATTIGTGYDLATYEWGTSLPGRPMPVAMVYSASSKKWSVRVGQLSEAGAWTWSAAQDIGVTAAPVLGRLLQRADGVWEFLYRDDATGANKIVRCSNLAADGTGTWS